MFSRLKRPRVVLLMLAVGILGIAGALIVAVWQPSKSAPSKATRVDFEWRRKPTVAEEMEECERVFVGETTAARPVMDEQGFLQGTFYTVCVLEDLKGEPAGDMTIYDENTSGRFPMTIGVSYLLFASKQGFENVDALQWTINNSGNSAELSRSAQTLESVRRLRTTAKRPAPSL